MGLISKINNASPRKKVTGAGLIFIFAGLINLPNSILAGIVAILTGLYVVPYTREMILKQVAIEPPKYSAAGVAVLGLALSLALMPSTALENSPSTTYQSPTPSTSDSGNKEVVNYTLTEPGVEKLVMNADYNVGASKINSVRNVDVVQLIDSNETRISVYHSATGYLNDEHIAKVGVTNSYVISRTIFEEYENIESVHTFLETNFSNQNGDTERNTAVKVEVSSETASEIDWNEAKSDTIEDYNNWLDMVDHYKIHMGICQSLETYPECAS